MSGLLLRPLVTEDEAEAVQAHEELAAERFEFLLGWTPGRPWEDLLASYERERRGVDLPEGRVPATFLVAEVDGQIVGRVSIRHTLNEHLARVLEDIVDAPGEAPKRRYWIG